MKTFFLGVLAGWIALLLGGYCYLKLGYAPAATADAPLPFEKRVAQMALAARIAKQAPAQAAVPATEANVMEGAKLYREHCAVCHGLSGQPKTEAARGMFPAPPQLFQGKGVSDDPPGETYWKVANGIRLTGMPAYHDSLTETQMWQIAQLLATSDKLPPGATRMLSAPVESK
jgi:thiosulfate dehydrogenase